jgi:DNA-binding transcriptional LysR family regulator
MVGCRSPSRVLCRRPCAGVPKSRISRRVALLEERLGVRQLARTTRGLGLTQVSQQVFEHARAAVIEAEAAEEVALRMQAEPRGLARLSCPIGLQSAIAAPVSGFLAAHPLLQLQCILTNRRVDLIHEGIDVAIRVRERPDTDADLQMKRVGVSRRILVASPMLLAKQDEPTTPAELGKFPSLHQEQRDKGLELRCCRLRTAKRRLPRVRLCECCRNGAAPTASCILSLRHDEACCRPCEQRSISPQKP